MSRARRRSIAVMTRPLFDFAMAIREPKPVTTLVAARRDADGADAEEREAESRPLDLRLIRRVFTYTRPYARRPSSAYHSMCSAQPRTSCNESR